MELIYVGIILMVIAIVLFIIDFFRNKYSNFGLAVISAIVFMTGMILAFIDI